MGRGDGCTRCAINFADALFLVLPVMLIATIPISIAGWGLRESAMVLAFSFAGLAESDGLIVSILFGVSQFSGRRHWWHCLGEQW